MSTQFHRRPSLHRNTHTCFLFTSIISLPSTVLPPSPWIITSIALISDISRRSIPSWNPIRCGGHHHHCQPKWRPRERLAASYISEKPRTRSISRNVLSPNIREAILPHPRARLYNHRHGSPSQPPPELASYITRYRAWSVAIIGVDDDGITSQS